MCQPRYWEKGIQPTDPGNTPEQGLHCFLAWQERATIALCHELLNFYLALDANTCYNMSLNKFVSICDFKSFSSVNEMILPAHLLESWEYEHQCMKIYVAISLSSLDYKPHMFI